MLPKECILLLDLFNRYINNLITYITAPACKYAFADELRALILGSKYLSYVKQDQFFLNMNKTKKTSWVYPLGLTIDKRLSTKPHLEKIE